MQFLNFPTCVLLLASGLAVTAAPITTQATGLEARAPPIGAGKWPDVITKNPEAFAVAKNILFPKKKPVTPKPASPKAAGAPKKFPLMTREAEPAWPDVITKNPAAYTFVKGVLFPKKKPVTPVAKPAAPVAAAGSPKKFPLDGTPGSPKKFPLKTREAEPAWPDVVTKNPEAYAVVKNILFPKKKPVTPVAKPAAPVAAAGSPKQFPLDGTPGSPKKFPLMTREAEPAWPDVITKNPAAYTFVKGVLFPKKKPVTPVAKPAAPVAAAGSPKKFPLDGTPGSPKKFPL